MSDRKKSARYNPRHSGRDRAEPRHAAGALRAPLTAAAALPGTAPLPGWLRAVANEALGLLTDGHHVLLAGAAGQGAS